MRVRDVVMNLSPEKLPVGLQGSNTIWRMNCALGMLMLNVIGDLRLIMCVECG